MKSGGSRRIVPCFALLAASTAVHGSPGQGDQMRPDATEARPAAAQAGNPRAVRGLKAEVTTKWEHSGFPAEKEGAIWPSETHFAWTFNKEFNEMNSVETESTAFALMTIANNNRSPSNVVALGADTVLHSDNGTGFAANFIVRTEKGVVAPKMVGVEIDIEPSEGVVPATSSIGLPINMFNSPNPGPAIQTGGINGGTFANGIVLYGIAPKGAGLAAGGGARMGALVNSSVCDCTDAAFVHGTGIAQGDAYGTGGTEISPYVYGDKANNLVIKLGYAGGLKVYLSDGLTPVFEISSNGNLSVNGQRGVSCSGPPTSAFRSVNGIVVHC